MLRVEKEYSAKRLMAEFLRRNWSLAAANILTVRTSTAMETHDLWVMLFKNSYFSKVKADLYETV